MNFSNIFRIMRLASLTWLLSAVALTGRSQTTVGNLRYTFSGSSATVSGYVSIPTGGALTIPSTVTYGGKTYNVVQVGSGAFKGCAALRSIAMPSIQTISSQAFMDCTNLKKVGDLPVINVIGVSAFFNCPSLEEIGNILSCKQIRFTAFYGTSLRKLVIPSSLEFIECYCFRTQLYPTVFIIKDTGTISVFDGWAYTNYNPDGYPFPFGNMFYNTGGDPPNGCRVICPMGLASYLVKAWNITDVMVYSPVVLNKAYDGLTTFSFHTSDSYYGYNVGDEGQIDVYDFNYAMRKEDALNPSVLSFIAKDEDYSDYGLQYDASVFPYKAYRMDECYEEEGTNNQVGVCRITTFSSTTGTANGMVGIDNGRGVLLNGPAINDTIYVPQAFHQNAKYELFDQSSPRYWTERDSISWSIRIRDTGFVPGNGTAPPRESGGKRNFYFYHGGTVNGTYWPQGFYACDGKTVVSRGKAYLSIDASVIANSKYLTFDFKEDDTPTSVLPPATFQYSAGRSGWYTLQGERYKERPTKPGIYINNGRKVFVK